MDREDVNINALSGGDNLDHFDVNYGNSEVAYVEKLDRQADSILNALNYDSPDNFVENVRKLLSQYPLSRLLKKIRERNCLKEFRDIVVAYAEPKLRIYAEKILKEKVELFDNAMNEEYYFLLALSMIKDQFTAEHGIETMMVGVHAADALRGKDGFSKGSKNLVVKTALHHDDGKVEIPNLALLNPFTYPQLSGIFMAYLTDPLRFKNRQPFVAAVPMGPDEERKFGPFVRGEKMPADRTDRALLAASYKSFYESRGGNIRQIPVKFLTRVGIEFLKTDDLPASVKQFLLDKNLSESDKANIRRGLEPQREQLQHVDAVMKLFGFDSAETTFKDALDTHAIGSATLLIKHTTGDIRHHLAKIVGHHHGKNEKMDKKLQNLGIVLGADDPDDEDIENVLQISDIIAALSQSGRIYHGGKSKPVGEVKKILHSEAAKHGIEPDSVRKITDRLLAGDQSRTDVLKVIEENGKKDGGGREI